VAVVRRGPGVAFIALRLESVPADGSGLSFSTYYGGRSECVTFRAADLHRRRNSITPFDCPRDKPAPPALAEGADGLGLVRMVPLYVKLARRVSPDAGGRLY
jgi:hypothetical protein